MQRRGVKDRIRMAKTAEGTYEDCFLKADRTAERGIKRLESIFENHRTGRWRSMGAQRREVEGEEVEGRRVGLMMFVRHNVLEDELVGRSRSTLGGKF